MPEASPCKTCPEWKVGFAERCLPTCKKVEEYQLRVTSGQAAYSDCIKVVPSATPPPPPQKGPQMSALDRLANKGEKKEVILKAIDFLIKQGGGTTTMKRVAERLGETIPNLQYWFQMLKKEGVISTDGGGSGRPATISWAKKKPEERATPDCPDCGRALSRCVCDDEALRIVREPGMPTKEEVDRAVEHLKPKPPVHPCPYHLDREQKVGKGGRRLGVCEECLSTRDSTKNLDRTRGAGRMVQLFFHDKHLDLKAWLDREAVDNERSIQQQIIFLLKQAKARTEPHVEKG